MNIERLLDALRQVESGGNRFAVSPKGSKGPYQFMPATAKEYNLIGDDVFDEKKSRYAAKKKLTGLIRNYGLEKAIAAYNMGEGNLEKMGGDYSKFPETAAYVPKVLAAYSDGAINDTGYQDKFPITTIPGVQPQEQVKGVTVPNVNIQQQPSNRLVDFSRQGKEINRNKLLAQALGNVDWGDPNAQISGRAIEMNPITAIAKALQTGMGAYHGAKANKQESDLDISKNQALQDLIQSGEGPNLQSLAASGLISPEQLGQALASQAGRGDDLVYIPDATGKVYGYSKRTRERFDTGGTSYLADPAAVRARSEANTAGQGFEYTDENLRPQVTTKGQYNPQAFPQQKDYTFGSSFLGNEGAPRPLQQSAESTPPASLADIEAGKAQAKGMTELPIEIQKQRRVGDVKSEQDVFATRQKAEAEAGVKREDEIKKEAVNLPSTINQMDVKIGEIEKAIKTLDDSGGQMRFFPGLNRVFDTYVMRDPEAMRAIRLAGEDTLKSMQAMGGGDSDTDRTYAELITGLDPYLTDDKTLRENYQKLIKTVQIQKNNLLSKHGMPGVPSDTSQQNQAPPSYDPDAMRKRYGIR